MSLYKINNTNNTHIHANAVMNFLNFDKDFLNFFSPLLNVLFKEIQMVEMKGLYASVSFSVFYKNILEVSAIKTNKKNT